MSTTRLRKMLKRARVLYSLTKQDLLYMESKGIQWIAKNANASDVRRSESESSLEYKSKPKSKSLKKRDKLNPPLI